MNIDDLTLGELKKISRMFIDTVELEDGKSTEIDNKMVGKYVIVRCRDAGVHAGVLESYSGRGCVLTESRRLWYWKTEKGAFLSGVAIYGLTSESKLGAPVPRIHLTENCEIIECSSKAEQSIREKANHNE